MASRQTVRSLFLGVLISLFAVNLFAADGHIAGRISRTNGAGIGGVIVQVVETGEVQLSDANGDFRFALPAGTYSLQFVAGENVTTESNVVVTGGATTRVDKQVDWNLSVAETITVYSASRRVERVVEAPSAVTVIAPEEIAAVAPSGQAPRLVESAPGVDYTASGLYDTNFNARGFNSSLNRRILTLVDGRDPAVAFLGSQEWAALSYPLDELASVELVRGPGSALYGANAFSGVLNMTTKQPKLSPGGRLLLSGGDLDTRRGDIRHAGGLGTSEFYYRLVGGYQQSGDFARSRNATVEYTTPCASAAATNCLRREAVPLQMDEVNIRFGGLRLDKHFANTNVLTAEGGYSTIEGPVFQTGIGRVQVTDVERPWFRLNYNMARWNIGGYYDARKAENQVALASNARLFEDSHNIHGEVMTNWDFMGGKTRVIGGVSWNKQEVDTANAAGVQTLMSEAKEETQQSAFGQLEIDVTGNLKIVGAARWDDSTLHESQFSPKAAIVFSPSTNHTLRYSYNEAFQRPNYSELFLSAPAGAPVNLAAAAAANPASAPLAPLLTQLGFNSLPLLARGNNGLVVEQVKSHEIGYAGIYAGKLFVTVDVYQSNLSDFVTDLLPGVNPAFAAYQIPATVPAPFVPGLTGFLAAALATNRVGLTTVNGAPALVFSYTNAGEVDTKGGEIALNYYVTNNWLIDFNYSRFDFDVKSSQVGDRLLPNAPENKFNLGVGWRSDRFDAKATYRWVEEFDWAAGVFVGHIPDYEVVNVSANFKINDFLGIGADISNAIDNEHFESFGGDLMSRRALGFVSVNW
ncbi:MAG TPA: TonB-dependent receptor [Thermoanaerobaculia bacterium]|jgi:iron complex outermembrane receptor protein|nr:TonB-dependent receptor [Thermoanaerobaculia bacterium]